MPPSTRHSNTMSALSRPDCGRAPGALSQKLETSDYRQRIAESLYKGVSKYVGGLSGVKVASKIEKNEGQ